MKKVKRGIVAAARWATHTLYHKPVELVKLITRPARYAVHDSYFPDRRRKSPLRIWADQLVQTLRYGSPNEFYFPYGFDVKRSGEMAGYYHYEPFMKLRDSLNIRPHSSTALLRDKMLFGMFTDYLGVASAPNYGLSSRGGEVFDTRSRRFEPAERFVASLPDGVYFVKPVDGECGAGIIRLKVSAGDYEANDRRVSVAELAAMLGQTRYLIQGEVTQHPVLAALHPSSLNTIRLVTVRDAAGDGHVEVFPSILRIGAGGSRVDNTSRGGLAVGIELSTGRLKEYGYYKPVYGTRTDTHPDTGIRFADVTIPFFAEAKAMAVRLHTMLPDIHSIGWDIAIGSDGPVFVEGNDNWEINGPQICNGGLRSLFNRYSGKK